ncbi:hypothetical protein [Paenibacillus dokdonensis]|uniref:hypothetical protein n=1 Tax=Paenibacillus dokdonensis TaxID=2567944 RepID=UPI002DBFA8D3|nr:hypothetical protein [Paenibacillus dokdonensis]
MSVVNLDDQEERLLNLALNKVSGRWDEEALARLLDDLQVSGSDLSFSGFDQGEIADLISSLSDVPDVEEPVVEDDFDVGKALVDIKEPETQRGDVWQLGPHRLVCGDATHCPVDGRCQGRPDRYGPAVQRRSRE